MFFFFFYSTEIHSILVVSVIYQNEKKSVSVLVFLSLSLTVRKCLLYSLEGTGMAELLQTLIYLKRTQMGCVSGDTQRSLFQPMGHSSQLIVLTRKHSLNVCTSLPWRGAWWTREEEKEQSLNSGNLLPFQTLGDAKDLGHRYSMNCAFFLVAFEISP